MIKVQDIVSDILHSNEEALFALSHGFMNLSAFAKIIQKQVVEKTKKKVDIATIVVSLSRVKKTFKKTDPLVQDIQINNITTKSPLTEFAFSKSPQILNKLSSLYDKVKTSSDDFLTMTLSTSEVTVICSDRIKAEVLKHLKEKPRLVQTRLASIGLSLDPKYYPMPNITFSLLRRIAQKRIVLAETISTHTEVIFVFQEESLPEMISLFRT